MIASALMCKNCASCLCDNTKCLLGPVVPPSSSSTASSSSPSPSSPLSPSPPRNFGDGDRGRYFSPAPLAEVRPSPPMAAPLSAESQTSSDVEMDPTPRQPQLQLSTYFGVLLTQMIKAPGGRVPLFITDLANFVALNFGNVWPAAYTSPPDPAAHVGSTHAAPNQDQLWNLVASCDDFFFPWRGDDDDYREAPPLEPTSATGNPPVLLTPASLHSHMACAEVTALKSRLDNLGLDKTLAAYFQYEAQQSTGDRPSVSNPTPSDDVYNASPASHPTFLAELLFIVFLFLEKLPHSLVPHRIGDMMIKTHRRLCTPSKSDEDSDLLKVYRDILLKQLPSTDYHLIVYLLTFLRHLWELSRHEEHLMENLVTGFSCTVYFESDEESDFGAWWLIVRALMIHSDEIFAKDLQFAILPPAFGGSGDSVDGPDSVTAGRCRKVFHNVVLHENLHQGLVETPQFLKIFKGEKALILPVDQILLHSKSDSLSILSQSRSSPDFKPYGHHLGPSRKASAPSGGLRHPTGETRDVGHVPPHHHHHHSHHRHVHHRHQVGSGGEPCSPTTDANTMERSRSHPSEMTFGGEEPALTGAAAPKKHSHHRPTKFYFGPEDEPVAESYVIEVTSSVPPPTSSTIYDDVTSAALALRPRMDVVSARQRLEEILTRFDELSSGSSGRSSLLSSTLSLQFAGHVMYPTGLRIPDDDRVTSLEPPGSDQEVMSDDRCVPPTKALSSKRGSDATLVNAEFVHARLQQYQPTSLLHQHTLTSEADDDLKWLEKHVAATAQRAPKHDLGQSPSGQAWLTTHWATNGTIDSFDDDNKPLSDDLKYGSGKRDDSGDEDDEFTEPISPDNWENRRPRYLLSRPPYLNTHDMLLSVDCYDRLSNQSEPRDLPPPSPPATHHSYKDPYENGVDGAPFHTLYKKLQTYEKKLKHYEEVFEKENGFKPSELDRLKVYEIKKYNSKIDKVKKELKSLKARNRPPLSPSYSDVGDSRVASRRRDLINKESGDTKSRRHSSPSKCDVTPQQTLLEAIVSCVPNVSDKVANLLPYLTHPSNPDAGTPLDRNTLTRLLEDISPELVWKQKVILQKILLRFERVHGKPTEKATIELMRPLYCKYRRIKNILAKYSPRHTVPELPTIIEGHQWDVDALDTSITSRGSLSSGSSFYVNEHVSFRPLVSDNETMHHAQFNSCLRPSTHHPDQPDNFLLTKSATFIANVNTRSPVKAGASAPKPPTVPGQRHAPTTAHNANGPPNPIEMGTMEISSIHSASLQELLEERRKIKAIRHRFKKLAYIPIDLGPGTAEDSASELPEPMGASPTSTSVKPNPRSAVKQQLKFYNYDAAIQDAVARPAIATKRAYFVPNLDYYETYKMAKNKLKLVNALIAKLENQKGSA